MVEFKVWQKKDFAAKYVMAHPRNVPTERTGTSFFTWSQVGIDTWFQA